MTTLHVTNTVKNSASRQKPTALQIALGYTEQKGLGNSHLHSQAEDERRSGTSSSRHGLHGAYSSYYDRPLQANIVGGVKSDIRKYRYQVSILDTDGLACGGSILSRKYVLTITPCVTDTSPPLIIHAGTSYWAHPGSVHNVEYNITYGLKRNTDIAILRVTEPFIFDETRQPIQLFSSSEVAKGGTVAVTSGWGITENGDWSEELVAVQVLIVDRQTCNTSFGGKLNIGEICAGGFGHDSCQGDSGGPLVIKRRLVGVTSMGNGCGLLKYPSIYADVGYFNKWIMQHISK